MNYLIIDMQTLTQAEKARGVLAKNGIRSVVERGFNRGSGCGFSLRVIGGNKKVSRGEVCALLKQVGINCDLS